MRDKDAVNAVLLICEAAAWYAKKGMTLGDAIDALYAGVRLLLQRAEELHLRRRDRHGEDGVADVRACAQHPLHEHRRPAGRGLYGLRRRTAPACRRPTCWNTACPAATKLIIRPSGTEPKIKAYLSAVKPTVEEATRQLDSLAAAAAELLA